MTDNEPRTTDPVTRGTMTRALCPHRRSDGTEPQRDRDGLCHLCRVNQ
jgi:hypothetical protein